MQSMEKNSEKEKEMKKKEKAVREMLLFCANIIG